MLSPGNKKPVQLLSKLPQLAAPSYSWYASQPWMQQVLHRITSLKYKPYSSQNKVWADKKVLPWLQVYCVTWTTGYKNSLHAYDLSIIPVETKNCSRTILFKKTTKAVQGRLLNENRIYYIYKVNPMACVVMCKIICHKLWTMHIILSSIILNI